MDDNRLLLQQGVAEFIGPFALVFLGAGSIIMTGGQDLVAIALAHGLALGVMIAAAGHISGGHYNPAVSIALAIAGKIEAPRAAVYVGAQLLGAIAAALCLVAIFTSDQVDAVSLGTPAVGADIEPMGALFAEVILTFFLMFVIFGTAVDERGPKAIAALAIGLTVAADITAMGAVTGAAMNPARHLGPALVDGTWDDFWVWWLGPIIGAALAAIVYNWVLLDYVGPGDASRADEGAHMPDQEPSNQRRRRRRR